MICCDFLAKETWKEHTFIDKQRKETNV